ncbi:MAG: stage V sporulation protein AB [Clostridia bacterium]|nr:stage V sporulation protein AB [Clostridia bacterium]
MIVLIVLIGLFSGVITAGGLFSLITSVGVINRYADVSDTPEYVFLYEEFIIIGATVANVMFVLGFHVNVGIAGCVIFGLISGIFVGTFLISLAETMKGLPIFIHRAGAGAGLGFIVASVAAGKALGQLLYYLYMY